ncbi:MAG: PEGA domain-containing protein [Planctomycetales bacterium]|nr:PEGA domain-containing protein [Planctomycetales bacterium]
MRSSTPGADVYVDRKFIGSTPSASTPFTYYGTRHIEVVGDGYRTEKVLRNFRPTWYQIPPLDFVFETLWPWEIRDERIIDIELVPQQFLPSDQLLARGNELRLQASQNMAIAPVTQFPGPAVLPVLPDVQGSQPQLTAPALMQPTAPTGSGLSFPNLLSPGNRIPESGILPGGGYRPPVGNES